MSLGPKAESVTAEGEPDGWTPETGYHGELDRRGPTRLVASLAWEALPRVHRALVSALKPPLSVLYRQKVDRKDPRPQTAPPRDFVAVDLPRERVLDALEDHGPLFWSDARAELWVRGSLGEQLVLDQDGVVYCYPDDPSFRDVLEGAGVAETSVRSMADRDYVKHWFRAECDVHETGLIADLGLQEVPHRKG